MQFKPLPSFIAIQEDGGTFSMLFLEPLPDNPCEYRLDTIILKVVFWFHLSELCREGVIFFLK